jgi:hypothetical protein
MHNAGVQVRASSRVAYGAVLGNLPPALTMNELVATRVCEHPDIGVPLRLIYSCGLQASPATSFKLLPGVGNRQCCTSARLPASRCTD